MGDSTGIEWCGTLAVGKDWPTDYVCNLPWGHAGEHHWVDAMVRSIPVNISPDERERFRWESLTDEQKQAESQVWWL